ncbi:unnamed protein product [Phytophthora fragariaefolia]|uniref:Unnamed protein product n=1 Tax=Phytophthora fragariaefolia TaxID=1490495 RepID=A0A9W7D5X9_9STRA|nr:unnamed protein product [Phytophthora fragariaefolia]
MGKIHRWALTLQEYGFDVQYRPGCTHVVADALSRAPAIVLAATGRRRRWRRQIVAAAERDSSATSRDDGSVLNHGDDEPGRDYEFGQGADQPAQQPRATESMVRPEAEVTRTAMREARQQVRVGVVTNASVVEDRMNGTETIAKKTELAVEREPGTKPPLQQRRQNTRTTKGRATKEHEERPNVTAEAMTTRGDAETTTGPLTRAAKRRLEAVRQRKEGVSPAGAPTVATTSATST